MSREERVAACADARFGGCKRPATTLTTVRTRPGQWSVIDGEPIPFCEEHMCADRCGKQRTGKQDKCGVCPRNVCIRM